MPTRVEIKRSARGAVKDLPPTECSRGFCVAPLHVALWLGVSREGPCGCCCKSSLTNLNSG